MTDNTEKKNRVNRYIIIFSILSIISILGIIVTGPLYRYYEYKLNDFLKDARPWVFIACCILLVLSIGLLAKSKLTAKYL